MKRGGKDQQAAQEHQQLEGIRETIVAMRGGRAVGPDISTEDLVTGLVWTATQHYNAYIERARIRRYLVDECGLPDDGRSTLELVAGLAGRGAQQTGLPAGLLDGIREALRTGVVPGVLGAQMRELVTGSSDVIEVPLGEAEVAELAAGRAALTEVAIGNGRKMDVVVKVEDTTGEIQRLWDQKRKRRRGDDHAEH